MTQRNTEHTFEADDFIDADKLALCLGISWKLFDFELVCDVSYTYNPTEPMTRDYPGEPEHIEDLAVTFLGVDITDDLTPLVLGILEETLMEREWDEY